MENGKKSHTITIKIDGKSRTYQDNKKEIKQEKSASSKTFVEDDGRKRDYKKQQVEKESLKQDPFQEIAAASAKKEEEDFDWILPDPSTEPELEEYKISSYTTSNKKNKSVFKSLKTNKINLVPSVFFALFLAVIIGMSFGFILLRLVISDQTNGSEGAVTTVSPTEQTAQPSVHNYTLPVLTTYVVQESVYTSVEGANNGKAVLDQKGIPSSVVTTDRSYVFVGVGDTKEHGKAIGEPLIEKGINIYAKEIQVGGRQFTGITDSEQRVLELASQVYAPLVSISTSLSLGQGIPEDASQKVNQVKSEWDQLNNKEIKNETVLQMKEVMDKALVGAINPSKEHSQEIQQQLLSFLSIYTSEK